MLSQDVNDGPRVLQPEKVPQDLLCSICLSIPIEPAITPCEHIFCHPCLTRHLDNQWNCPVDRMECRPETIKRVTEGVIFRIWSQIQVKCEHHDTGCAWTGGMGDYAKHIECCRNSHGRGLEQIETVLRDVERERDRLQSQLNHMRCEMFDMQEAIKDIAVSRADETEELNSQLDVARLRVAKLSKRPNLPPLFHGEYDFNRHKAVELGQLISRYLECKPRQIDSCKIFCNVKHIYSDLQKGWEDNPKHYYMDVRCLLATAASSTWFTDNQMSNISTWISEQGWS
eukprot:CAMPEP_0198271808 /NCGR_PEP_ID=MMETSP1447-20131203/50667_1 /TAXON_ID=420782 /ORGANISM="Chaetoceros dichaeta, Strain CCMP1751" /LENGTH=284 /DNA_ID=CAMNT_0043964617 /DNA_START=50 /DNA_END=904 /DNA_ORIENTATION=+